jgi:general stress protein CsbA
VILGYGAIIINALFLLVCLIFASLKVNLKVQAWIIGFNVLLFCGEVYFHFFFK